MMKAQRLTELDVRFVGDHGQRPTWQLIKPMEYYSALLDERIEVPAGFITDFASVPRIMLAYMIFGGRATWEAVVHDYLLRGRDNLPKKLCDDVFLEAMESDGEPKWRRKMMYYAVRIFGADPYR